jgi:heme/copper-type cytochrome/quinol oxidase subunit 4
MQRGAAMSPATFAAFVSAAAIIGTCWILWHHPINA